MNEKARYKRRHYFVKKDYQFRFIVKFCLIVFLGALISSGLLFLFSRGTLTSSFDQSRLTIEKTSIAIMPAVLWTNAITLALITLATVIVVLFVSHKIAGPLFRFEKELREIAKGDLSKSIHLRREDQITEMAEELNRMTAGLRDRVRGVRSEVDRLIGLAAAESGETDWQREMEALKAQIQQQFKL